MTLDKTRQHKKAFLLAFAECGSITEAALAAEVDRTSHYLWMKDPKYAGAFQEAQDRAARMLEDEAVKRARTGGSDTLLIFLLKCRNRAVFGDRHAYEHSGPDGKALIPFEALDALFRSAPPEITD